MTEKKSRNWFTHSVTILMFWFWYAIWLKVDPAFSVTMSLLSAACIKFLFFAPRVRIEGSASKVGMSDS